MRFSSFIAITAAGLAVAMPITPVDPYNIEKQLTVEPTDVIKRQTEVVTDAIGKLGAGGLPVKRQTEIVTDTLSGLGGDSLPLKRQIGPAGTATGAASALGGGLPVPVPALPLGKRQLEALLGSSDVGEKDIEPAEPKAPKGLEDDDEEATTTTETETAAADDLTSGVLRRQIPDLSALLGGSKDPAPVADAAAASNSTVPADASSSSAAAAEATPAPAAGGLGGILRRRQLNGLLGGDKTPKPAAAPVNATAPATTATTPAPAAAPAGGLGGILRRQLSGLLGGDKKADPAAEDSDSTSQTLAADDGTNGENSFDAQDDAAAAAAPAAEETPAPAPAAGGLGGLLGM